MFFYNRANTISSGVKIASGRAERYNVWPAEAGVSKLLHPHQQL